MRVLIVGAGIAGPTLAYWLHRFGHQPTLGERAPQRREGGYIVDFWGAGFDVADRMGIVPQLIEKGYRVREVREVSATGRRVARFDPRLVLDSVEGRYVSIARTDLSAVIYSTIDGVVETIFDDTVQALEDSGDRVRVEFTHRASREFDAVIGADGLHSRVRELAFGPEQRFERPVGITVAAFDIDQYRPRDELTAVTHTVVGAQALRFALRDGASMFCFTFRDDAVAPPAKVAAQQQHLRTKLHGIGWEVPEILERMPQARTFYFDTASQIRMPSWSRGRVGLVGDAAACPSLLAGQGSALAMVEAYVLAIELHRSAGDPRAAFAAYQRQLAPLVTAKQDAALGLTAAFAPRNRTQLALRNMIMAVMGIPLVAKLALGRSLRDPVDLPPPPAG
jgi:2-polyprenyl-6-methoxyphenol hydroxylase-like FAD-dependent oxidoreductase